jgi:hypothetical protein
MFFENFYSSAIELLAEWVHMNAFRNGALGLGETCQADGIRMLHQSLTGDPVI